MFESLVESVRKNMVSSRFLNRCFKSATMITAVKVKGIDRHCLSATLIKNQSRTGLDEREMAWLASTM